jgi:ComF family protein
LNTCRALLYHWFDALASVLFPVNCVHCGQTVDSIQDAAVCRICWEKVIPLPDPHCQLCGYPLASPAAFSLYPLCGPCRRHYYAFDHARALGIFENPLKEIIHHFKYNRRQGLAYPLARILAGLYSKASPPFDAEGVIPVPLHPTRQRERGFNQSEELARHFCKVTHLPLWNKNLCRVRPTLIQAGLSRRGRRLNIKGAFCLLHPETVKGKKILLLDDVFTTGVTLNECSLVLKKAGAAKVSILTVARVV